MRAPIAIEILSRERLEVLLPDLERLDGRLVKLLGTDYSEQGWGESHFRLEIPRKWELSRFALQGDRLAGFWIASAKVQGACHTHRVAVEPSQARLGVGTRMLESLLGALPTEHPDLRQMTLEVGYANGPAQRFYMQHGFAPMRQSEIREYLERRGRVAEVASDFLLEADGSRFRVLHRAV